MYLSCRTHCASKHWINGQEVDSISPVPHLCHSPLSNASEKKNLKNKLLCSTKLQTHFQQLERPVGLEARFNIPSQMLLTKQQLSTVIKTPEHPLAFPSLIYFVSSISAVTNPVLFTLCVIHPHFAVGTCMLPPSEEGVGLVHSLPLISLTFSFRSPHDHFTREK